jgi:hypothetical protein
MEYEEKIYLFLDRADSRFDNVFVWTGHSRRYDQDNDEASYHGEHDGQTDSRCDSRRPSHESVAYDAEASQKDDEGNET